MLLLCCNVLGTSAQYSDCTKILEKLNDAFFDPLRKVESDGDLCKVGADGNELGPYQISEEYYDEAVEFDPTLGTGGLNPVKLC